MGAWGYKPFDTDGAGDWSNSILHKIATGVRSRDEEVARAAAQLLVVLDPHMYVGGVDTITDAINRLEEIREDDRFLAQWDSPAEYKRALGEQLTDLRAMLRRAQARAEARKRSLGAHRKRRR